MDFLYSVFDFFDKVLYFISGLEINNKIDMGYQVIDALYYFLLFRIIILVPLLIVVGVIIYKIIFKKINKQFLQDDFIFIYTIFILFFASKAGIDTMIIFIVPYILLNIIYRIIHALIENKNKLDELQDRLNEIEENLK